MRGPRVVVLVVCLATAALVTVTVWRATSLSAAAHDTSPLPSHATSGCHDAAAAAAVRDALAPEGSAGPAGVSRFRCTSESVHGHVVVLTASAETWAIVSDPSPSPTAQARPVNEIVVRATVEHDGDAVRVKQLASDFAPGGGP